MNIRNLYLVIIVFSALGLLFEWNSEQKSKSIEEHMLSVSSSEYLQNDDYVTIENEELALVVSVSAGSIVESRLKKYSVENVDGSLGFRVFGSSENSSFKYYFKSGFTGVVPNYKVYDYGADYVELVDETLGISKKISFLSSPYEVSVYDSSSSGVEGKSYAKVR